MTPWEKLVWMQEHCHEVHVSTNEHRGYYETVEQSLSTRDEDLFEPVAADVKAECIRRNKMTTVQVYPITPIGFYRVAHYDLGKAIDLAYECVFQEIGQRTSPAKPEADR